MRLKFLCLAVLGVTSMSAAETTQAETPKRKDSVKKAVYGIGKLEQKDISVVESFKKMFQDGKVSGQVRVEYAGYNFTQPNSEVDRYTTAIGGILKYELAEYKGFNAAVATYASKDIHWLSGKGIYRNTELSSSEGEHTDISEAYINYKFEEYSLRAGRQLLDTPLADSDDVRMIKNTFEAYIAKYEKNHLVAMGGYIVSWHGTDADLDRGWARDTTDGTPFVGVSYADMWEYNAWYYNLTGIADAVYVDFGIEYDYTKNLKLHSLLQYLHEKELDKSGYGADIYGGLFEVIYKGFGVNLAYNHGAKKDAQESFAGTGGGALVTNMDTITLDVISKDRQTQAIVGGFVYEYGDSKLLYAYGDFSGEEDSLGDKAHIVEQNFIYEYNVNDEFLMALIYAKVEDKESAVYTENDFDRLQVMLNYNF